MADKEATVATTSSTYDRMSGRWSMINALMGGTEAMRAAGEEFLPKFAAEEDKNYDNRLKRSTLTPYFERTVAFLTGKPFSKPIVLGEDMATPIKDLTEDIDLQGNNLDTFAWKVFACGLSKGFTHILVEYPTLPKPEEGQPVNPTLADEKARNPRPYWCHISPDDLIAAYSIMENGIEKLVHIRYKYCEIERVGFEEVKHEYVMVREPGRWEKWMLNKDNKWVKQEEGTTTLQEIPLVTFYAAKEGLMFCKPPMLDLAYLNVTHWQSASDQRNILTVSRFPILFMSGIDSEQAQKVVVGPNRLLTVPDANGRAMYVEHGGAAITSGEKDMAQLAEDMQMFGLEMLMPQSGTETATARALDAAEMQSPLQLMTLSFKDALEAAFVLTAKWMDVDEAQAGSVAMNTEFGISGRVASDLDSLLRARANGDISRETLLEEMKRRGVLSADFDVEEEMDRIADEPSNITFPPFNPPGGGPDNLTDGKDKPGEGEGEGEGEGGQGDGQPGNQGQAA